ncbi:MAG: glutathione S-transferase family protein [Rhizobacter sp.]|nr:glutathione S-transferase family protein [Burkholderiales bacterium]
MKLYGSKNSRSLRCTWALEEVGASYDYQHVWLMKGEGQSPAFKAINPAGKIPVLSDGDMTLTESVAIVMYVAEKFPDAALMPTNAKQRAEAFRWIFFVVSEVEAHLWTIAQHRFALPEDKRVPAVEATCVWQLQREFRVLEKFLTARPFISGDRFTAADILVTHCLTWALSAKLDGVGQACLAYIERMKQRPAFARAVARERDAAEQQDAAATPSATA